jgi:hypothetical protein
MESLSMPPPRLSETLEIVVKSLYGAALAGEPSVLAECGSRLLDRISPPNWTLEWSLPGWLGSVYGLDTSTIADLTLADVFGLTYIKLQDDLLDGEVGGDHRQAALLLSSVLHRKWLLVYSGLFPEGSLFWSYFEQYMTQWVRATWTSHQQHSKPWAAWGEADLLILGQRGAPLKICAAAACLLAQRAELIPQLESALDHLLIGAVLLDHALDWTGDLAAGRYNAFVAYASLLPQTSDHVEANRRAVAEELVIGRMAQPYFQLLRRELAAASAIARQAGCEDLARFIAWLRRETFSYSKGMAATARDQLHRAIESLFMAAETHAGV